MVAEILGVSTKTVSRMRGKGKIAFHRLPGGLIRFAPEDVEAFLLDCHRPASPAKKPRRKTVPKKSSSSKSAFSLRKFDRAQSDRSLVAA